MNNHNEILLKSLGINTKHPIERTCENFIGIQEMMKRKGFSLVSILTPKQVLDYTKAESLSDLNFDRYRFFVYGTFTLPDIGPFQNIVDALALYEKK